MIRSENDQKNAFIRVYLQNESYTVQQLFTRKFSAREPKCLTGVAVGIGIVSTCEKTTSEIAPIGAIVLFCLRTHIRHEGINLPTSLTSIFEFYASTYPFVFTFKYQSNLGTILTSLM